MKAKVLLRLTGVRIKKVIGVVIYIGLFKLFWVLLVIVLLMIAVTKIKKWWNYNWQLSAPVEVGVRHYDRIKY